MRVSALRCCYCCDSYILLFHIVISLLTTICCCNHNVTQALIIECKHTCHVFGSGSFHGTQAQFQQEYRTANSGRTINLLCLAEARMTGLLYDMHRGLHLPKPLLETVHSKKWLALENKTAIITRATEDTKNDVYWKRVYIVL